MRWSGRGIGKQEPPKTVRGRGTKIVREVKIVRQKKTLIERETE